MKYHSIYFYLLIFFPFSLFGQNNNTHFFEFESLEKTEEGIFARLNFERSIIPYLEVFSLKKDTIWISSELGEKIYFISQIGSNEFHATETMRGKEFLFQIPASSQVVVINYQILSDEQLKFNIWERVKVPFEFRGIKEGTYITHFPASGEKKHRAVLILPGGGYGIVNTSLILPFVKILQSAGYEAFVLNYQVGPEGYHYPVQLQEAQRAMRWVKAKGEIFGYDPEKTGVIGFSAGGHLAGLLATRFEEEIYKLEDEVEKYSPRPAFQGLIYPVISFESGITHEGSLKNLTGKSKLSKKEREFFSNQLNVTAKTPPAFLVHTWEDELVIAENSILYYQALKKNGVKAALHIFEKGHHGAGIGTSEMDFSLWPEMMINWLKDN